MNPQKIASQSEFELKDEAGEFLDSKRRIGAEYVDLREDLPPATAKSKSPPKPRKEDLERLERLKKRDTGKSVDKL